MPRRNAILAALLIALTICAYWPAVTGQAAFIWDDDAHITGNTALHDLPGLTRIWTWAPAALFTRTATPATPQYYPMTFTSFWLEYQLWDLQPLGYHITNILLHLASAILLWIILRRLGLAPVAAWFAAALFALHPVNVESVAWVTERKNTLSLLLFLASALAYIRWARLDQPESASPTSAPRGSTRLYLLALALFLLAVLSKTVTVTLPVALLLLTWWKRGRISRKDFLAALPLLLLGIALGLFTVFIEYRFIGARGPDWQIPVLSRLLIAGRAPFFYLGKLFLPVQLTFMYPRWDLATDLSPAVWTHWLYPAGLLLILAALWALRRQIGRGPLTAALFFLLMLLPALGFFNFYPMRYSFVADHFQYAAALGIFALVAAVGVRLHRLIDPAHRVLAILAALLTVGPLLATLTGLSLNQSRIYAGDETLWRDTLAKNPRSWMALENLANILLRQQGDAALPEAITLFKKTITLKPNHLQAYNSLGVAYLKQRDTDTDDATRQKDLAEADRILNDALSINAENSSADPDSPEAQRDLLLINTTLASVLIARNQPENAELMLRRSLDIDPDYVSALIGLGNALQGMKKYDDALQAFDHARSLQPQNPLICYNMGVIYFTIGKPVLAEHSFRQALKLRSDYADAWNALGRVYRIESRNQEAIDAFSNAVRYNDRLSYAYYNMGETYMALHQERDAESCFRAAVYLDKKFVIALASLSEVLSMSTDPRVRNPNEAVDYALQANQLTENKDVTLAELLAQAYAEAHRYDEAVSAQRAALEAALKQEKPLDLIRAMQDRYNRYILLRTAYFNAHPDELPLTPPAPAPESPATLPASPGPATTQH